MSSKSRLLFLIVLLSNAFSGINSASHTVQSDGKMRLWDLVKELDELSGSSSSDTDDFMSKRRRTHDSCFWDNVSSGSLRAAHNLTTKYGFYPSPGANISELLSSEFITIRTVAFLFNNYPDLFRFNYKLVGLENPFTEARQDIIDYFCRQQSDDPELMKRINESGRA